MNTDSTPTPDSSPRAVDPILAELWQIKRDINRESGYDIDELVRMAHVAAERTRQQWQIHDTNTRP